MLKTFLMMTTLFVISPFAAEAGGARSCFDMDPVACETFHRTNDERAKNRLPAFEYSGRCFDMAQEQSDDMARRRYFDHNRPATGGKKGETFSQRAARFGLGYGVGENIAMTQSVQSAVQMWMKSPGHRRNILNRKFRYLAVGHRNGLFTQVFAE